MPILRRRTQPAATTDQSAGTGAVPGQRDNPEGSALAEPAESRAVEGRGTTGTGPRAAPADYRQTEARQAEARQAESHRAARHPYYGMAGMLMFLSGLLTFFIGITGIIRGVFFNTVATYPFYFSVRSRGITLLVIGSVACVVGLALLIHMHWARNVATVVAVASAVANFMFLPFYPFWSIVVLTLDVIIIWELLRERGERGERTSREYARY